MAATEYAKPGAFVTPGIALATIADGCRSGDGTYELLGIVRAAVAGKVRITDDSLVIVERNAAASVVPHIGSVVMAKVMKVNPRLAAVEILVVDGQPLVEPFHGIIRVQDVRRTEIDKVKMYECFRPCDIVLCDVISLGDRRSYYLSTARNELGVVFAKSIAGFTMLPISWQEMQCPRTGAVEQRKVAKVDGGAEPQPTPHADASGAAPMTL
eukprot:Amastigsp_a339602_165.p1 type:complete len:212 gc:universal Amastigsp_a339602_165:39-674(+)